MDSDRDAVLLLGFALLACWADVANVHAHRNQRALERARTRRADW